MRREFESFIRDPEFLRRGLSHVEFTLQLFPQLRILEQVRGVARIQIHQARLALGGTVRRHELNRQHTDHFSGTRDERRAVYGPKSAIGRRAAI